MARCIITASLVETPLSTQPKELQGADQLLERNISAESQGIWHALASNATVRCAHGWDRSPMWD